ncbi:MAG: ABC transporter ATP-binding protein, partial [Coleofasciculaceae cyanobacterium RL_1_1]|nr:ABC transporter ATP-binding protein [Coleofasciculaceae cyanobacterium RL_1_1]
KPEASAAIASTSSSTANKPSSQHTRSNRARKLSYKERRELETLETRIPDLENEKATIEGQLYGGGASRDPLLDLSELTQRLAAIELEIDAATERWMELSEIAEASA